MIRLALFLPLVFGSAYLAFGAARLDPHGPKDLSVKGITSLKLFPQCAVCHAEAKGKLSVKDKPEALCANCHSPHPHSGSAEHLDRLWKDPGTGKSSPISCLTCHDPHRGNPSKDASESGFFARFRHDKDGLSYSPHPRSMLRRSCTECHRW